MPIIRSSMLRHYLRLFCVACIVSIVAIGCASTNKEVTKGAAKQVDNSWPSWLNWIRPYQPPLSQGVLVTKETVSQLKRGMTREQVQYLLGSAPIQDPSNKNRWDYPFLYDNGEGTVTTSLLSVFFNQNSQLASVEGGSFPTEPEFIQLIRAR